MPTTTSDGTQQQPKWTEKYRGDLNTGGAGGQQQQQPPPNVKYFDFGRPDIKTTISAEDWATVEEIELKDKEIRAQALEEAQKKSYCRVDAMPFFTLRDGHRIPAIGLGTWKAERGKVRQAVHLALQAGYRHIDCASVYQNEDEVGDALHQAISRGYIPRSELFVCSKVWNSDHSAHKVREACLKSLKALKLEYFDLYLIHWPVTGSVGGTDVKPPVQETWQAMEELVKDGLVRSIGCSNFSIKKLSDIERYAVVKPSVCQVEIHPYHRNEALLQWCLGRGIHVTAFSPLGSPDSESIFPRKRPSVLLKDPVVAEIAESTGKNVGQVLIRWALQHGTSVIPKSTNPDRIAGNLDVLDWALPEDAYRRLSSLKFQQRMVNGAMWLNPKGPYVTMEDLWDEKEVDSSSEESEVEGAVGVKKSASKGQGEKQQEVEEEKLHQPVSSSSIPTKGKKGGWGNRLSSWMSGSASGGGSGGRKS